MKYLQQFGIILAVSFVGELLNYAIPLSIPASIYGLVLMFVCLCMKWIKLEDVKETAVFLIEIMPLMFIPAAVGLITSWNIIRPKLLAYAAALVVCVQGGAVLASAEGTASAVTGLTVLPAMAGTPKPTKTE